MKRIAIGAIKGGVGKTTVSCGLALALQRGGRNVGLAEIDITGSTIWKALGLTEPPPLICDTAAEKILPSLVKGIEVFTIASYFKASGAMMVPGADTQVVVEGATRVLKGTGKREMVNQMLKTVRFSEGLDYLIYDLPPSTGDELLSLWDNVQDIWGVVIVSQPTSLSREGLAKTMDMLTFKKLPLLGLIVNMDGVDCPECHAHFNPFADTENLDNPGMPIIARIPFTKDLNTYFDAVAEKIEQAKPVKLGGLSLTRKLIRKIDRAAGTTFGPTIAKQIIKRQK